MALWNRLPAVRLRTHIFLAFESERLTSAQSARLSKTVVRTNIRRMPNLVVQLVRGDRADGRQLQEHSLYVVGSRAWSNAENRQHCVGRLRRVMENIEDHGGPLDGEVEAV